MDVGPFQRQVRALMRTSYRDSDSYDRSSSIAEGMRAILDQARGFVEGGDSADALSLLEAITEEYAEGWSQFDDSYGTLGDIFEPLREGGQLDAALQVAQHGLSLSGPRGALDDWLASLARGLGRADLALRAAEVACASEPSMARHLAARDLAGEGWPDLRARLLEQLCLLAQGQSNQEIAASLGISNPTVRAHVTSIPRS